MKKFLDEVFKPYVFPIILAFLAVFFRENLDFKPIKEFFSNSSNNFVKFFSAELYLWQIIVYGTAIYIISKLYSLIFRSTSKAERKMLRAIRKAPKEHKAVFADKYTFYCKYSLTVKDEQYKFDKFTPYCLTCTEEPIRMPTYAYGDFKCNCGSYLEYGHIKDIKSRIMTLVEKYE